MVTDELIQLHIGLCMILLDIESDETCNKLYWFRIKAQCSRTISLLRSLKDADKMRDPEDLEHCERLYKKALHKMSMQEAF